MASKSAFFACWARYSICRVESDNGVLCIIVLAMVISVAGVVMLSPVRTRITLSHHLIIVWRDSPPTRMWVLVLYLGESWPVTGNHGSLTPLFLLCHCGRYTTKKMLSKTASLPSKNVILEALLDEMEAIP